MKFFEAMAQVAAGERVCRRQYNGDLYWLWVGSDGEPRDGSEDEGGAFNWLIEREDIAADDWEVRAAPVAVGSFTWALDQVQHGKRVRRRGAVGMGSVLRMDHYNILVMNGAQVLAPALARLATYNDWEVVE